MTAVAKRHVCRTENGCVLVCVWISILCCIFLLYRLLPMLSNLCFERSLKVAAKKYFFKTGVPGFRERTSAAMKRWALLITNLTVAQNVYQIFILFLCGMFGWIDLILCKVGTSLLGRFEDWLISISTNLKSDSYEGVLNKNTSTGLNSPLLTLFWNCIYRTCFFVKRFYNGL